ncbi:hypothetical protein D1872_264880 [compost metagenome]
MREYAENIRVGEDLPVIVETDPRLLRAIAVPVRKAEIHQLGGRVIGEQQQQGYRNKQEGEDDEPFLFFVR